MRSASRTVTLPTERKQNALYPFSWRFRGLQSWPGQVNWGKNLLPLSGFEQTQPVRSSYTNWAFVSHLVLYTYYREITLLMACLHRALMINDLSHVSSWSLLSSENEDEDRGETCLYLLHPREIREMTRVWSQWTNFTFNKNWVSCFAKIRLQVIMSDLKSGSARRVAGVGSVSCNTVLVYRRAAPASSGWDIRQWAA